MAFTFTGLSEINERMPVKADDVTNSSALMSYDSSDLSDLENQPPQINYPTGKKYHRLNSKTPDVYQTDPSSQQSNGMQTMFFLPKGFNVDSREHGNYQSIVVTKDNLYLLESMGTDSNQGAIIKISMNDIKQMGLDTPDQINSIAEAFHFYSPLNKHGYASSKYFENPDTSLSDFSSVINGDKESANHLSSALNELSDKQDQSNTTLKYWNKILNRTNNNLKKLQSSKPKNKIAKSQLKANQATAKQIIKHANNEISTWQKFQNNYQNKTKEVQQDLSQQQAKIDLEEKQYAKLQAFIPKLKMYKSIVNKIKVTGLMDIGHGQSLSYNPVDNGLYLIQDDQPTTDPYNHVIKMNPDTLNVEKRYSFLMPHDGAYYKIHTLTFDNQGNAYVGRSYSYGEDGNKYIIFKGNFSDNSVYFQPEKQLIDRGNPVNQYISYDASNNRIYIVSNDLLTSVPLDKLNQGTLTPDDVNYTLFDTHREFEGLSFDQAGNGYQLLLWSPEVMKYNYPLN